jgi:serine/threonine protein kinase
VQVILGTPHYIAPETITDPERVGPAVDIYALGAVGYYLLTGQRVFEGKTPIDVCTQHATKTPTPPTERGAKISRELEAIILRCLAKLPSARFSSASELADALQSLPRAEGWSRDDARAWWRTFDDAERKRVTHETPTQTITVDIGEREAAMRRAQASDVIEQAAALNGRASPSPAPAATTPAVTAEGSIDAPREVSDRDN